MSPATKRIQSLNFPGLTFPSVIFPFFYYSILTAYAFFNQSQAKKAVILQCTKGETSETTVRKPFNFFFFHLRFPLV